MTNQIMQIKNVSIKNIFTLMPVFWLIFYCLFWWFMLLSSTKENWTCLVVARQRRPHFTVFANFEEKEMPTKPYPEAVEKMKMKIKDEERVEKLKEVL